MKKALLIIIILLVLFLSLFASDEGDAEKEKAAIKQAALDYIEGWYEGNFERMDRVAKCNGQWMIVNVLWERNLKSKSK